MTYNTDDMTKTESELRGVLHWHTDLREVSPELTQRETAIYNAISELQRLREQLGRARMAYVEYLDNDPSFREGPLKAGEFFDKVIGPLPGGE